MVPPLLWPLYSNAPCKCRAKCKEQVPEKEGEELEAGLASPTSLAGSSSSMNTCSRACCLTQRLIHAFCLDRYLIVRLHSVCHGMAFEADANLTFLQLFLVAAVHEKLMASSTAPWQA